MSKYEVVQRAKSHGLSGGTHVWTVGQVLDSENYTVTTISHLLANGVIRPVQVEQEAGETPGPKRQPKKKPAAGA